MRIDIPILSFCWKENTRLVPIFVLSVETTADDYFVTSNGAVYYALQAAYIVLRIMGYLRVSCLPSTIILSGSVCVYLSVCFCSCVCMCELTTRNSQS